MTTRSKDAGPAVVVPESWKNTVLAGMANYIDGGSIVAGSATLALWAERYNLSPRFLGVIVAFCANAIAAGVGALVGFARWVERAKQNFIVK